MSFILGKGQTWSHSDLTQTANAPEAKDDPFGYRHYMDPRQTTRVVYLGSDNHVHELWLNTQGHWTHADLTP